MVEVAGIEARVHNQLATAFTCFLQVVSYILTVTWTKHCEERSSLYSIR